LHGFIVNASVINQKNAIGGIKDINWQAREEVGR